MIPRDAGAKAWHHFYSTSYWLRRRQLQLTAHPLCKFCTDRGAVTRATVVDHVKPHRGDWNKFCLGELQSLCASCHDRCKRFIETRGHSIEVGDDGWPIDPNHPANRS
jgi:5-methylcytosine-specific restriction endonuclease McrA